MVDAYKALGGMKMEPSEDDPIQAADKKSTPRFNEDLKRLDWYRQNRGAVEDEVFKYGTPVDFGAGPETKNPYWDKFDRQLKEAVKKAGHKWKWDEIVAWEEGNYAKRTDLLPSSSFKVESSKGKTPEEVGSQLIGANEYMNADVLGNFLSKAMDKKIDPRTMRWCTYFVSSILKEGGTRYADRNPGAARAYLNFGSDASSDPQPGDLWVTPFHAALILGIGSKPGFVRTLEGNHDDGVYESEREVKGAAIRRPPVGKK